MTYRRGNIGALRAHGRLRSADGNKLEQAYGQALEFRRRIGEIEWFAFESLKLRLADNTFYTPDFFLMLKSGELQVHETKGFWEEDARVKIKVAASLYPFRFFGVKRARGEAWELEEF